MRSFLLTIAIFLFIQPLSRAQIVYDTLKTVKMTSVLDFQNKSLSIQWIDDPEDNTYSLYKKLRQDTSWGSPLISVGNDVTSYLDTDIEEGKLYEYRIVKTTGTTTGYGYLFSGIDYVSPHKKGDIMLLIDTLAASHVAENLQIYMDILTSEGWIPWLVEVDKSASAQDVKSLITQYHLDTDSLQAVLLLGDIAVPHSGNINPDAHSNHKGAWPADLYYGDIDGVWTDVSVDNTTSAYPRIHNVPGDGNFDQNFIPSSIELAVGRIDFSELPIFEDLDEYQLLDRYLQKNIDFRTGKYQVKRQAVFKNTNQWMEGLGQNAIRNFGPLVSNENIVYGDYFDAFYDSFLWSYGGSSGSMICSNGMGCIDTYADNNFQAVFTANFGSYFGDYDFENNFLRTMLASGKVLSSAWVGAPNWYFHPMGMGMDLGFCTLLTQNNVDTYYAGYFPQSVTINLLGDPTLRAFNVIPPSELYATQNANQVELNWSPSADDIIGYQVLKKDESQDYFEVLNDSLFLDTNFIDKCVEGLIEVQYLVKAVKREITPSGSYINYSSGPILSIITEENIIPTADFEVSYQNGILKGTNLSSNSIQYKWTISNGFESTEENFEIPYNQSGQTIITLIASNYCFSDTLEQTIMISNLGDLTINEDVLIYPNPAQNSITLKSTSLLNELKLYNVLGELVLSKLNLPIGTNTINSSHIANGVYIIKIKIKNQEISQIITIKK